MFQMRAIICFSLAWIVPVVTTSCDPVQVKRTKERGAAKARQAKKGTTQQAEKAEPYVEKAKSATIQAAEEVKGTTPH
jgi:hypothetical protein